jgi:hypothetical protein
MVVKFKKITFQNILSFGANSTEFDFEQGVNLISGKNGSGKCLDKNTMIKVQMEEKIFEKYIKNKS